MRRIVKLRKQPEARNCVMFAAWPGIGNVSLIAVRYLREKLNAVELGGIDSSYFFEPTGVVVRDNIVEEPRFPENNFYYWQDAQGEKGMVLFVGEEQPSSRGHELVSCVLDVAQKLKITRIYSCAAAVTHIHHREKSRVWGVATGSESLSELEEEGVILKGNLRIAGLNGLVLGMARERGVEGVCLLGEVPSYAVQIENPKASLAVLEVLVRMTGIEVDLTELASLAEKTSAEVDRITKLATAEYIDQFTEPIWERDEGEE